MRRKRSFLRHPTPHRCCGYSFRTAPGGRSSGQAGSSRRASAQAQEQFGPFADRWLVAIRCPRPVAACPPGLSPAALAACTRSGLRQERPRTKLRLRSAMHPWPPPATVPTGSQSKAKRSRTFCMDRAPTRQLSKSWQTIHGRVPSPAQLDSGVAARCGRHRFILAIRLWIR